MMCVSVRPNVTSPIGNSRSYSSGLCVRVQSRTRPRARTRYSYVLNGSMSPFNGRSAFGASRGDPLPAPKHAPVPLSRGSRSYPPGPMLLEISTTHSPASDLGYLLHKHPAKVQLFSLAFGHAHVFYPEASDTRCTAALLLDVDPVALVRGKGRERTLDQYVNDRPYVASSMLAVAIAQVFGTALSGICKARPELVTMPIPLTARIAALPCRGGEDLLKRLFEPLGYHL